MGTRAGETTGCKIGAMKSETRRLNKLTGASKNIAKRYKLTTAAAEIIDQAGEVHGQKSRAVQIAVELLWRTVGLVVDIPDAILQSPMTGRTYKLPQRTVMLIEALAHEYREYGDTQGAVLAACYIVEWSWRWGVAYRSILTLLNRLPRLTQFKRDAFLSDLRV